MIGRELITSKISSEGKFALVKITHYTILCWALNRMDIKCKERKSKARCFDLGNFSASESSSETDEDTAAIKKALFVQHQEIDKRNKSNTVIAVNTKKRRKNEPVKEEAMTEEKRKDVSQNAKRRKLIDDHECRSLYHDQGYVHIPVPKVEPDTLNNTLRRSARTRVPVINHLLGEQLIYEASASGGMVVKEVIRPATSAYQPIKPLRKHQKQSSKNTTLPLKVQEAKKKKHKHRESSVEQRADEIKDTKSIAPLLVSPRQIETFGDSLMESMFEATSSLATDLVEIINDDGTTRPPVEVVKPLQSLRLCNTSGSAVTPSDPFIMAILSKQKNTNFGVAILNKMGNKGEQCTEDSSVCFFLVSGEIMVKIGDLELHPPLWSRIFIPEGISYALKNLQHTPAVLVYIVIKPNKDHD